MMKKIFYLSLVLSMLSFMTACSSDDESDGLGRKDVMPAQEFAAAFSHGGWQLKKVYDVFADGSKGPELLIRTAGAPKIEFVILDDTRVRQYLTAGADLNYMAVDTVGYAYNGQTGELAFSGGKMSESLSSAFTVKSVDGNTMTCSGPVFSGNVEAKGGLYIFERLTDSNVSSLESMWHDKQVEAAPIVVTPIAKEDFMDNLRSKVWLYKEVCGVHEDGTLGESIIPGGTTGREALFADNGCRIMEVVLGEGNAFVEQNDLSTFLYGNLYANSLHFSSVGFEALQNIFRLSTISDKTMECIGWPTAQLQQADPKAVRALYRFECITDSITQP